jgi:hypothetical protein
MQTLFIKMKSWLFLLVATMVAGTPAFSKTINIKLVRPLGAYEEGAVSALSGVHALEEQEYHRQLYLSFYSLGLGYPRGYFSVRPPTSKLTPQDQETLIETELRRMHPGFLGVRQDGTYVLEQMVNSKTYGKSKPKETYDLLGKLFPSRESSARIYFNSSGANAVSVRTGSFWVRKLTVRTLSAAPRRLA